jgi:hypothetical protein
MELYFGFGIIYKKDGFVIPTSPLISCIESGDHYVVVLKESISKVGTSVPAAQPIGISSMNASFLGYMEDYVHAMDGFGGRPDWLVFSGNAS